MDKQPTGAMASRAPRDDDAASARDAVCVTYRITRRPDGRWELRRDGARRATGVYGTLVTAAARAVDIASVRQGVCEILVDRDRIIQSGAR
jgi:predicted nucleotidyltransferase